MVRRDDEDRERRSWREIDHLRDHPEERSAPGRGRQQRSGGGFSSYRNKLSRLFDMGGAGKALAEAGLGPDVSGADASPEAGSRAPLVQALRAANSDRERHAALDALLAAGEALPPDTELLARQIDHPREEVVRQILEALVGLVHEQPLKRKAAFLVRLETIELTAKDAATAAAAERLQEALD